MRPERRHGGRDSGRRVSNPARLSAQESWRESDKSREREGRALAVNKAFSLRCSGVLGSPTPRTALEHVAVMQQAIEHGAHGGDIAE
jgi:hypothetical protein